MQQMSLIDLCVGCDFATLKKLLKVFTVKKSILRNFDQRFCCLFDTTFFRTSYFLISINM